MLLNVGSVTKMFADDIVLEAITLRIERREKVALVGRNGAGKTTLLKLIMGEMEPDAGTVTIGRGVKVGLLRQNPEIIEGRTVLQEAESAAAEALEVKRRLDEIEPLLESGDHDLLDEYAQLQTHLHDMQAWDVENDVKAVLTRMGFLESEFDRPVSALSGGEKTRLALARLLLEEPDLLILDEPTNHLDLQATEWLENWVRQYPGAVLLVSHDRMFLENTVERVVEIRQHKLFSYPGNFNKFLQLREEEDARITRAAEIQSAQIAKLDEYVRRFMNSQRTAQARGRQKLMNRMVDSRIEAPSKERNMAAGFRDIQRSGTQVWEVQNLSFGYKDLTLGKGLDWIVRWGERWGVIGENGAGKSTLIKTILGEIPSLSGTIKLGSGLVLGWFSQDAVDLDPDETPIGHIMESCGLEAAPARNLLGRFLIEGDDVFRPVGTLSGGEKNKLVLAELTQLNPNLLVLDEPTNHLDMASREALGHVLKEYPGTLILISHDRRLLAESTQHIIDIRHSGAIKFDGSFNDYRLFLAGQSGPAIKVKKPQSAAAEAASKLSSRELSKLISRTEDQLEAKEKNVAAVEAEIKALEEKLANLGPKDNVRALSEQHKKLDEILAEAMAAWEQTGLELTEIRALREG